MFTFALLEGAKQRTWEFAGYDVNYLSIEVMASVVSLIIALCISVFMEGKWVPSLAHGFHVGLATVWALLSRFSGSGGFWS